VSRTELHHEAATAFKYLLQAGMDAAVPEVAEVLFAEATGLVKYPFLAEQITMATYDDLIEQIALARRRRFKSIIGQQVQFRAGDR